MTPADEHSRTVQQLAALAEPSRLRILEFLVDGPRSVTEIAVAVGISLAVASHHLNLLRRAGILTSGQAGKQRPYGFAPGVLAGDILTLAGCRFEFGPASVRGADRPAAGPDPRQPATGDQ